MNYEVSEKKGESQRVGLREVTEGQYEIKLGGETIVVDAVRTGPSVFSLIENGRQFEVVLDERGEHGFDVLLGGRLFQLEAINERMHLLTQSAAAVATGPQSVEAEMPGKVVKIVAPAGENVVEGQGVVIVEAMKMENEIASPIDGVVKEISVAEGDTVEPGDMLFVVEPPEDA